MSTTRPANRRAPATPLVPQTRPAEELRRPAALLGTVYQIYLDNGGERLGKWAIPKPVQQHGSNELRGALLAAIRDAYTGAETRNEVQPGVRTYINAYHTVIPRVAAAARQAAIATLNRQVRELNRLDARLARGDVPQRLHSIAEEVGRRVGGFYPDHEDLRYADRAVARNAKGARPDTGDYAADPAFGRMARIGLRRRVVAALGEELSRKKAKPGPADREVATLGRVLSAHPDLVGIMADYADSATYGARRMHVQIDSALAATAEFDAKLRLDPDHVWRYPPLITLAVRQLGLADLLGFPEYAVDIGRVISHEPIDDVLFVLGMAMLFVLIFVLPPLAGASAAVAAHATVAVGILDLGLTDAALSAAYLREREQDVAGRGAEFRVAEAFAARSDYAQTGLAAAAALLAGLSLASAWKLPRELRARTSGAAPPSTPSPHNDMSLGRLETDPPAQVMRGLEGGRGMREVGGSRGVRGLEGGRGIRPGRGIDEPNELWSLQRRPTLDRRRGAATVAEARSTDTAVKGVAAAEGATAPAKGLETQASRGVESGPRKATASKAVEERAVPETVGADASGSGSRGGGSRTGGTGSGSGGPGGPSDPGGSGGTGGTGGTGGGRPPRRPRRPSGEPPRPTVLTQAEADRLQAKYSARAGDWYPPEEWAELERLEQRYPLLERAQLRPKHRMRVGDEHVFDERMKTTQSNYSLSGYSRGHEVIELDGISVDGWVIEVKIEQTSAEKIVVQLRREADFAQAYGLKGVLYNIEPPSIADEVERLIAVDRPRNTYRVR